METLNALKRRLESTEDLQSVVKSMKALAAASIRQYERAADAVGLWRETVEMGLQIVLRDSHAGRPRELEPTGSQVAAIVVGSDQGMCGQFNDDIAAFAERHLTQDRSGPAVVLAVGERVAARLHNAGLETERRLEVPHSATGITDSVARILVQAEKWRRENGAGRILLFHNRRRSGASYEPERVPLWPLDMTWLQELAQRPWESRSLPMYRMDRGKLTGRLIQQYLFVVVFRALAESLASEQASRLASMQVAEKDIGERLEELTKRHNQQRQQAITAELLDIIASRESLGK